MIQVCSNNVLFIWVLFTFLLFTRFLTGWFFVRFSIYFSNLRRYGGCWDRSGKAFFLWHYFDVRHTNFENLFLYFPYIFFSIEWFDKYLYDWLQLYDKQIYSQCLDWPGNESINNYYILLYWFVSFWILFRWIRYIWWSPSEAFGCKMSAEWQTHLKLLLWRLKSVSVTQTVFYKSK